MIDLTKSLNSAQAEATETLNGPLLILAGAGSGKTKTLTHRIANLIQHGTPPDKILAVTFTNKAAKEMRNRLWQLLNPNESGDTPRHFMPYMGTFHSIAVRILRTEAAELNLDPNFIIYDADDQITLIRRILKELKLADDKNLKPKMIQSIISNEKNHNHTPEDYYSKAAYSNQKSIAEIFRRYETAKTQAGALDFDDLLIKELELLEKHPHIRQKWQNRFEHILIDEYQDTNGVQYNIIRLLVNDKRNICVVGDDWQSIYSWRGADFTNILNFEKDFPGAKVIRLEQNYRSTGNILDASQKIINHNKQRAQKVLFTELGQGDPIDITPLRDESEEANFVALKILNLLQEYPAYSNFAVLYRTNAQSFNFEKAFIAMHIPYRIVGGVRFYDRKEIKDVLAILKLIENNRDKVSLERIVKNVISGIGEASLVKILNVIDSIEGPNPLFAPSVLDVVKTSKAKSALTNLVDFLKSTDKNELPSTTVKRVIEHFNFNTLVDDGTPSSEDKMGNLEVLIGNAANYETLPEFLIDAALMSSADESGKDNAVTLMTMHSAKGLEFPVVFIVGLEDGLFPGSRSIDDESYLEEERRLMYVGMTRAMKKLFLTYANSRYMYGNRNYNIPSRFLAELGYDPYSDTNNDGFIDDPFPKTTFFDPFSDDLTYSDQSFSDNDFPF